MTPAGASSSTTVLTPGQVVSANPTTELPQGTQPADGRLRGPDFRATVTSVAWPASVQGAGGLFADPTYVPGSGQRLVVFTLQVRQLSEDVGAGNDGTQMSAALMVGRAVSSIDLVLAA